MKTNRRHPIITRLSIAALFTSICLVGLACKSNGEADDSSPARSLPAVPSVTPKPTPTAIILPVQTFAPRTTTGGDGNQHRDVHVTVDNGTIVLDTSSVQDTEAYFDATNLGAEAHHLAIVKWDGDPSALPVDPATGLVSGVPLQAEAKLAPNRGVRFEVEGSVADTEIAGYGTFVLYCTLPGHYARGEYATFTLLPP